MFYLLEGAQVRKKTILGARVFEKCTKGLLQGSLCLKGERQVLVREERAGTGVLYAA